MACAALNRQNVAALVAFIDGGAARIDRHVVVLGSAGIDEISRDNRIGYVRGIERAVVDEAAGADFKCSLIGIGTDRERTVVDR